MKYDCNNENNYHSIRAWVSNNYLDIIYNYDKNILSLDYYICDDNIKIEYLCINNDFYSDKFNENVFLTKKEYMIVKNAVFNYIENIAIYNNKYKLIIDIHNNLDRYNAELKDLGFINTYRKCYNNFFWYEAEKILKK